MFDLDAIDKRLLNLLQRDATVPIAELAERVGLSQTPCWKRIKRMEQLGILTRRVALLDRNRLGVGTTVFVSVRTSQHDEDWLVQFADAIRAIPEVTEFYRMSGDVDYLLKIVCRDIADYDRIYKAMIRAAKLSDVSSSFAMEQIKYTTEVPI